MIRTIKITLLTMILMLLMPFTSIHAATPVRNTDVDTPAEGNAFITMHGNYYTLSKTTILNRINAIRKEACEEGLVNPSTGNKLTLDDYNPIKWSSDLEWIAQTRAAEATLVLSHVRPNETLCFTCTHNGVSSWGENLAWNWDGILYGINQWYSEKDAWVEQDDSQVTGHYTSIINPNNNHIGIGCFRLASGGWYTVSAEFSSYTGLNEEQVGVSGLYDQLIEIPEDKKTEYEEKLKEGTEDIEETEETTTEVTKITISGISHEIAAGKTVQLNASVTPGTATNKKLKWTSSNTKIATVSQNGKVSIKKGTGGKSVTITATATDESGKSASFKIQVMKGAVKSVKIKGAKKTLKVGKKMKLKAVVKTTKGKPVNKKVKWSSSNTKYATVSAKGVVKALKAGKGKKIKITAMATDGTGKKKTITIKIK